MAARMLLALTMMAAAAVRLAESGGSGDSMAEGKVAMTAGKQAVPGATEEARGAAARAAAATATARTAGRQAVPGATAEALGVTGGKGRVDERCTPVIQTPG